jgi:NAD+ kinase
MRIALYSREIAEHNYDSINDIIFKLISKDIKLYAHINLMALKVIKFNKANIDFYSRIDELKEIDYIICIGGDGTMLDTVNSVRDKDIPLIGVNSGRLGFLTNISMDQVDNCFEEILDQKHACVQNRMLLELKNMIKGVNNYALNEITVQKANSANLIIVHTYVNGHFLNSYWADGLIISTPTGSTAYSLSVGGPIVSPNCENIIITPIAPHNLTMRPIVIPAESDIRLEVESRDDQYMVSVDSKIVPVDIKHNTIHIKKSKHSIKTVQTHNQSFFDTIRNKLMWGSDRRN